MAKQTYHLTGKARVRVDGHLYTAPGEEVKAEPAAVESLVKAGYLMQGASKADAEAQAKAEQEARDKAEADVKPKATK